MVMVADVGRVHMTRVHNVTGRMGAGYMRASHMDSDRSAAGIHALGLCRGRYGRRA